MCRPVGAPPIPRPSDLEFGKYAKKGNMEQLAEALLHYPDLVHVQDNVSDLKCSDVVFFTSPCVIALIM